MSFLAEQAATGIEVRQKMPATLLLERHLAWRKMIGRTAAPSSSAAVVSRNMQRARHRAR